MDKLMLVGNVGKDSVLNYTPNGQAICRFSLACSKQWKDKNGQKQTHTTWYQCNIWGKLAEAISQYLTKGTKVAVEGQLQSDEYGNPKLWTAQDGSQRASYQVNVKDIELLGGGNGGRQKNSQTTDEFGGLGDDLNFGDDLDGIDF